MPTPRLTPELIAAAVEGYESQKARIDQKIAELRAILSGGPAESAATPEPSAGKAPEDECRWQEGDCRSTTQEMGSSQESD